jgi:putative transposase
MQLFTLHPTLYKLNKYVCPEEKLPPEAQELKKKLTHCSQLRSRKVPWEEIEAIVGMSRSNYYRLSSLVKLHGIKGLIRRSKKPKKLRQSAIPVTTIELILQLRRTNPTYGKAKITVILARDHNIILSASSVGRVIAKLVACGKIRRSPSASNPCRSRKFNGHAKRWEYGKHKAAIPGEMVQIDHMSVSKNGVPFKHFQAWDPKSKFIDATVFSCATSHAAKKFLQQLIENAPFKISSIQVDGGSEFMAEFEEACKTLDIPLFVLPPKSPKYNGGVERGNRIFREEFYSRKDLLADSIGALKIALKAALHKYNTYRPHQALKFLTPMQYIQNNLRPTQQSNML